MVAARDRRIWQRAQALQGPELSGDAAGCDRNRSRPVTRRISHNVVALAVAVVAAASLVVPAAAQGQRQEPNRGGQLDLSSEDPRVALERLRPAPGYEVNLFASRGAVPRYRQTSGDDL